MCVIQWNGVFVIRLAKCDKKAIETRCSAQWFLLFQCQCDTWPVIFVKNSQKIMIEWHFYCFVIFLWFRSKQFVKSNAFFVPLSIKPPPRSKFTQWMWQKYRLLEPSAKCCIARPLLSPTFWCICMCRRWSDTTQKLTAFTFCNVPYGCDFFLDSMNIIDFFLSVSFYSFSLSFLTYHQNIFISKNNEKTNCIRFGNSISKITAQINIFCHKFNANIRT